MPKSLHMPYVYRPVFLLCTASAAGVLILPSGLQLSALSP